MHHAVIMAGGSGTRLWPLSSPQRPKQLLRLFAGKSLLRLSYERLAGLLPAERIHLITGADQLALLSAELPELPPENLIGEPTPRDTANAVGLAAWRLRLRDPDGVMGIFTADQIITPVERFQETVRRGFETAERQADALITFGIRPTSPHTGYGYVQRGPEVEPGVFEVVRFKEKPDLATAQGYLDSGGFDWNSGMFVWRLATIVERFRAQQPETARVLDQIAPRLGVPAEATAVKEAFGGLPRISVDYAILEQAPRVLNVPMDCAWLDVGSWTSLAEIVAPDDAGNTVAGARVVALDATDNVMVSESDHLIAAIGVEGLVIVHSPGATLVCRREDAQRVKEIAEQMTTPPDSSAPA